MKKLPEYSVLLEGFPTWIYCGLACLGNREPSLFLSVVLQRSVAFMELIRDTTFKLYWRLFYKVIKMHNSTNIILQLLKMSHDHWLAQSNRYPTD